jgi:hypothetical protein
VTGRIEAVAHDDGWRILDFGLFFDALHALEDRGQHLFANRRLLVEEPFEIARLEAQQARGLERARARYERTIEHDRNLAHEGAGLAHGEPPHRRSVAFEHFEPPLERREEHGRLALVDERVTGANPNVGGRSGNGTRALVAEIGEQRNAPNELGRNHDGLSDGRRDTMIPHPGCSRTPSKD